MNYLQYTSKEMFSATELIRKSKKVFDSVKNKEIDKAIILRDGKPSFILFDFEEYEKIMNEYITLKESFKNLKESKEEKKIIEDKPKKEEINEDELQKAIDEINNLPSSNEDIPLINEKIEIIDEDEVDSSKLKDFWE